MDILLQLQSARKNKTFFAKLENVPYTTVSCYLRNYDFDIIMYLLLKVEELMDDSFYLAGIIDASFCKRKVSHTFSYSDLTGIIHGLGDSIQH